MSNSPDTACDGQNDGGAAELGDDLGRLAVVDEGRVLTREQKEAIRTAIADNAGQAILLPAGLVVQPVTATLREEQEWILCTAQLIRGGDRFAARVTIDGPLSVMALLRPAMASGPGTVERSLLDWRCPEALGDVHGWDRDTYRRLLVALHAELVRLLSGLNLGVESLGIELEAQGVTIWQRGRD